MVKAPTTGPSRPYANTRMVKFLNNALDSLSGIKNQREVAAALGYDRSNIISMFKTGETKVPLDKLPALAEVLGADLLLVLRLGLEQYWPSSTKAVNDAFASVMTKNERALVDVYREVAGDEDWKIPEEALSTIRTHLAKTKAAMLQ